MIFRIIEDLRNTFPNTKIGGILYNGSDEDFKKVDFSKINLHDDGYLGKGFYLTADPYTASEYGKYLKEFYVNITNPFCFNNISDNEVDELSSIIVNEYGNKILAGDTYNFLYWVRKKSQNDDIIYLYTRIKNRKATRDDLKFILELILKEPSYIIDGALMDFSDIITPFIKSKGYDGAYINSNNIKYYEVVVYSIDQIKLVK